MTSNKREKAIKYLTEEIRSLRMAPEINGCGPENWAEQLEIMETCLEEVRSAHFADDGKMQPLTFEQLRNMGGQPYWHVGLQEDSPKPHWKILDPFVSKHTEDYGYGKRWLAYAYPPAHIDREAICGSWEGEADGYADGELVYDVWRCGDCGHIEETDDPDLLPRFCPNCGRAMTPEAWAELEKRLRG